MLACLPVATHFSRLQMERRAPRRNIIYNIFCSSLDARKMTKMNTKTSASKKIIPISSLASMQISTFE